MGKRIGSLALKIVSLLLFALVATITIFFAYGYQFDFKLGDVRKTSIIDLSADISDVTVLFNGEEVADNLPYQIKNITPGEYEIYIEKTGFSPWGRKVIVKEDIVTIVRDIILVPENLAEYITELHIFSQKEEIKYYGKYILSYLKGAKDMVLTTMFPNGKIQQEVIEFYRDGIDSIEIMNDERFLVAYLGGGYAYVNFYDGQFESFYLPEGAYNMKVDSDSRNIYFIKDGTLYTVPFSMLPEEKESLDLLLYRLEENVKNYDLGFFNEIYFISDGILYKMDSSGGDPAVLDEEKDDYANLDVQLGRNYAYLILRDASETRYLYLLDKQGEVQLLSSDLKGKPFLNGFDRIIYQSGEGSAYFYDPLKKEELYVTYLSADSSILGWFSDYGHFIVKNGEGIFLMDIYNANQYILNSDSNVEVAVIFNKAVFYTKENTLYSLYWKN
jgi:hypothetical protein